MDQRYVLDDSPQRRLVANRSVESFLPFLVPHLCAGMDVLDAGCGTGSIALDVASRFSPRRVVGIDLDAGQVDDARQSAAGRKLDNAEFFTASVYQLPFPDASFDVVYSVSVFLYLRDPGRALVEMRRVLRPGGLAAVTADDAGTIASSPDSPLLRQAASLLDRVIAHEGGNTRVARHVRSLMVKAGFARTQGVAHVPEVYGDPASTRWYAEFLVDLMGAPSMREVIVGEGWAGRAELDAVLEGLREWGDQPDAFLAWLYCGALGWT